MSHAAVGVATDNAYDRAATACDCNAAGNAQLSGISLGTTPYRYDCMSSTLTAAAVVALRRTTRIEPRYWRDVPSLLYMRTPPGVVNVTGPAVSAVAPTKNGFQVWSLGSRNRMCIADASIFTLYIAVGPLALVPVAWSVTVIGCPGGATIVMPLESYGVRCTRIGGLPTCCCVVPG